MQVANHTKDLHGERSARADVDALRQTLAEKRPAHGEKAEATHGPEPSVKARINQLQETIRSVSAFPEVAPRCYGERPSVSFRWGDRSSTWTFIEEADER